MGSIPVANPASVQRPHISRRGLFVLALPLGLLTLIVTIVAFAWPRSAPAPKWLDAGSAEALTINEPVRNQEGRFWLVKLESGEIIALSQRSTHLGCTVPWRPDFEFQGRKGWFRDPCSGTTWDVDGRIMFGPAPRSMDRYRVDVRGDRVFVDTSQRLCSFGALPGGRDGCSAPPVAPAS